MKTGTHLKIHTDMKKFLSPLIVLIMVQMLSAQNPRLVILADMGNEPDEEQQMIHMMVCSNELELEGLIAVTGLYIRPGLRDPYRTVTHPELFHKIIDAYAEVYPNLQKHASGWHEPKYLHGIVAAGNAGYGIDDVGEGKSSQGSELIVRVLEKDDPRPVWVVVNAGSNTLAQALFDFNRKHTRAELDEAVSRLRVYENGAQDNAGAWICSRYPLIHWIRSNYQTYAYGGPGGRDGSVTGNLGPNYWHPYEHSTEGQHEWLREHVQTGHGALGEIYPDRKFGNEVFGFMEGGGTTPWMCLVNKGLSDIDHPEWGGWSGRFTKKKVPDFWSRHLDIMADEIHQSPFYTYREASDYWVDPQDGQVYNGDYVPVWRWREAMYNDFMCRMDWCVKPFEGANHHPVAVVNGDEGDGILHVRCLAGEELEFDASASSDPDGDELNYSWWIYEEAGTYAGKVFLASADREKTRVSVPTGAGGTEIHLILEVRDAHQAGPLFDYRRIVIGVEDMVRRHESIQTD
jgi:hypothetical protein